MQGRKSHERPAGPDHQGLPALSDRRQPGKAEGLDDWKGGTVMGTVARVVEISATSDTSFDDAVTTGISRACTTLRNVKSAWVKEQHVTVADGQISEYKVHLLVTFVLDE